MEIYILLLSLLSHFPLLQGVFKDIVEWCLVVTTPEEAIICALAREYTNDQSDSHLVLIPTRYEIPTDSVPLLSICGTPDGRIFMGGYDGCLYEMSYEANMMQNGVMSSRFFSGEYEDYDLSQPSLTSSIASAGKRALSSLVFGPSTPSEQRARKCRKVNHSSFAPPVVSAFVPGFVLKASSAVFGSSPSTAGGPIVNLTYDQDRQTMYALTANGYIHAFDLDTSVEYKASNGNIMTKPDAQPPKWACSVNVTKSVRKYLDSVSHGRMYPPGTMGSDAAIAAITFPGGGAGAKAGVGGMEGARSILKTADAEIMKKKSHDASRRNNATTGRNTRGVLRSAMDGCLHPISIHVVPSTESKFLTLVAISSGGLRYYLSVLPDAGTSYGTSSVRPGRRFTLCHIRAPPPFVAGNGIKIDSKLLKGCEPRMANRNGELKGRATRGCYKSGVSMLTIDCDDPTKDSVGDAILSITPDYTQSKSLDQSTNHNTSTAMVSYNSANNSCNGVKEMVSLPTMDNSLDVSVLPGGHVWELNVRSLSNKKNAAILRLFSQSTTPSSVGQNEKVLPAYFPPSNRRNMNRTRNSKLSIHSTSALDTASTMYSGNMVATGGVTGLIKSYLLGRRGISSRPPSIPKRQNQAYRLSETHGCDIEGFSVPRQVKNNMLRKDSALVSSRLPNSTLKPPSAPLSELAKQHLLVGSECDGMLALNSGGIHYFGTQAPVQKLQLLLQNSHASTIGRDESVKSFFKNYCFGEGCAMALSLAINPNISDSTRSKAVQSALSFAHRPSLSQMIQTGSGVSTTAETNGSNPFLPQNLSAKFEGYTFKSSFLLEGLTSLISRLMRPIWCKPAVVVTEGKIIPTRRKGGLSEQLPAKVELLLDQHTLDDLRKPLVALQIIMKDIFGPAVKNVPGAHAGDADMMDMTDSQGYSSGYASGGLINQSLQYQNDSRFQNNSRDLQPTEKEVVSAAEQIEERNIHALYRLVSRTVQLLSLFDHLRRAHYSQSLPDVEFGLLHGLTFSQLVTMKAAQDRIEALLTNLFSSSTNVQEEGSINSSVETDNLCSLLSQQCYLYFSVASRLTFLGFRNAEVAMSTTSISKQNEHTLAASNYLREASKHWHSSTHIIGQLKATPKVSSTQSAFVRFNDIAMKAIENGSPLARAISILMELRDVEAVVDICINCSRNFDSNVVKTNSISQSQDELISNDMLPWEKSLYHRHLHESQQADPKMNIASNEQESDLYIQRACHALLYFSLGQLLESVAQYPQDSNLVEKMLSIATSYSNNLPFLYGLFEYLASSGHVDTLLRIDSHLLEKWLLDHSKDSHLLWRYYTVHNIHWMAGEVVWNRAISASNDIPLAERLECLTRAQGSYSIAQRESNTEKALLQRRIASGSAKSNDSLRQRYVDVPSWDELNNAVAQISEQIDVAKIQTRLLATILSSSNAKNVNEEQLSELKFSLVDISKMYNDFAGPLRLYDICLAILHTCKHDDSPTITKLWRSIFCEELIPCRTTSEFVKIFLSNLQKDSMLKDEEIVVSSSSVSKENGEALMSFEDGSWMSNIKERLISLGKELHGKGSDFTFPIHFIAECLEGIYHAYMDSNKLRSDFWPIRVLAESGCSMFSILDAYHTIYTNSGDVSNSNLKMQQLSNIAQILNMWISVCTHSSASINEVSLKDVEVNKRLLDRYSSSILGEIDNYKATIESFVGCDADKVARCYNMFDDIENSLRRRSP